MAKKVDRVELTSGRVERFKPRATRYIKWDKEVVGLGCRVFPSGAKSFVVVRPEGKGGRTVYDTLGAWPALSASQARQLAKKSIEQLAEGHNPRRERLRRQGATVAAAVEAYLGELKDSKRKKRLRSLPKTESYLRRGLCGQERDGAGWRNGASRIWRDRKVNEIRKADARALLKPLGSFAARNTLAAARAFFAWLAAGDAHGVDVNPFAGIRDADIGLDHESLRRDRTFSRADLRAIWAGATAVGGPYGALVKALLLTGQRVQDLAGARMNELDGPWLSIGRDRYKTGRAHEVYLPPAALALIEEARRHFPDSEWLFPADRQHPVFVNSYRKRALDEAIDAWLDEQGQPTIEPWVLHDLRAAVHTGLLDGGHADFFTVENPGPCHSRRPRSLLPRRSPRAQGRGHAPVGDPRLGDRRAARRARIQRRRCGERPRPSSSARMRPKIERVPFVSKTSLRAIEDVINAVYDNGDAPQHTVNYMLRAFEVLEVVWVAEAILHKHGGRVYWRTKRWRLDAQHLGRAVLDDMPEVSFGYREGKGVALVIDLLDLAGWRGLTTGAVWHMLRGVTLKKPLKTQP